MNVEIGTEAAEFPEKEYIKWDFRCSAQLIQLTADSTEHDEIPGVSLLSLAERG
jgi:hypothetical protein